MPVEVEKGPIGLRPVRDGDQDLVVYLKSIQPNQTAIMTLDLDNTKGWLSEPRVEVDGFEVAGGLLTLAAPNGSSFGEFNISGRAILPDPAKSKCGEPKHFENNSDGELTG